MKRLLFVLWFIFLGCALEKDNDLDSKEDSEGACVIKSYFSDYSIFDESCYNNETKSSCDDYLGEYLTIKNSTLFHEDSNCMDEGYTKGCGGYFKSDDDEC